MTLPAWWPDWSGERVVIVASGPSALRVPLDLTKGRARVVAVNNSWELVPWADVLFAADFKWWATKAPATFDGLKVTTEHRAAREFDLRHVQTVNFPFIDLEPGRICFCNSGMQALNFAVHAKPARIALVGFDMTMNGAMHWHADHSADLGNPNVNKLARWRRLLDDSAPVFEKIGIDVVIASPGSALTAYPRVMLGEFLRA